jgi:hypothetical protein
MKILFNPTQWTQDQDPQSVQRFKLSLNLLARVTWTAFHALKTLSLPDFQALKRDTVFAARFNLIARARLDLSKNSDCLF